MACQIQKIMEFINRIGAFFLWVGAISLLLFFFSSVAETAHINFLIAGFVFIVIGAILWSKNTTEKPKNSRFRLLRNRKSKKTDSPQRGTHDNAKPKSEQN